MRQLWFGLLCGFAGLCVGAYVAVWVYRGVLRFLQTAIRVFISSVHVLGVYRSL